MLKKHVKPDQKCLTCCLLTLSEHPALLLSSVVYNKSKQLNRKTPYDQARISIQSLSKSNFFALLDGEFIINLYRSENNFSSNLFPVNGSFSLKNDSFNKLLSWLRNSIHFQIEMYLSG